MRARGIEIPNSNRRKKKKSENAKPESKAMEAEIQSNDRREQVAKMIVGLMNTKNATKKQVILMGKYYGVSEEVETVLDSLDKQSSIESDDWSHSI